MLRLIETKQKPKLDYEGIYLYRMCKAFSDFDGSLEARRKIIYYTVKYFNVIDIELFTGEDLERLLTLRGGMMEVMSQITPADLITIFPISKTYDGAKYEMKDYYSAMEAVNAHGLHERFKTADNARELLWEYWNRDIRLYQVKLMSVISGMNQRATGETLMERFFREQGANVGTYRKYTDQNGNSFMVDDMGRSVPVRRTFPKHIRLMQ